MAHPAIAKTDCHVQHGYDTIHHTLAFIIQEAETRIRDNPKVVGLHQFFEDALVIILDSAHARRFEPALVTAHTMRNLHIGGVNYLYVVFLNQGANRVVIDAYPYCI